MITRLSIQGLAIIDSLEIDFTPGFNVITGETGAGKSILIRALGFITGGKVSPDTVRRGSESATVVGEFEVPKDHYVKALLTELGIESDGSILVRRQVHAKGRSQAWVNDVPVAVQSLKTIGTALLDVFAQHENQRLLNPNAHTDYVDSFLKDPKLRENVASAGRECQQILGDLREKLEGLLERGKQSDYLAFRLQELQAFEPSVEDFNSIQEYCEQAEASRRGRDTVALSLAALEPADGAAVSEALRESSKALAGLRGPFEALRDRLGACAAEAADLSFELGRLLSGMDFDEQRLEECQQRLFGYQDLFRKHGVREVEALVEQFSLLGKDQAEFDGVQQVLGVLVDSLIKAASRLKKGSAALSTARLQAAQTIKAEVESELADLHMPGSVFQAEFSDAPGMPTALDTVGLETELVARWKKAQGALAGLSAQGAESAQFFLSANRGEPPMPLAKVASGGELSRIMLALKKALAADAETCVLVFDEIDTGISGRVADVVGRKMAELSARFQVLCISHLPQVAVHADSHFLVTKKGTGERTESSIVPLTAEQSAKEIARLLSGEKMSSTSLANAKNLIAVAHKRKKKPQGAEVKP
ncbi:DNA repair protein RecN [bacterium]|nr:DNA repair protein RecN [bacterium]